MKKTVYCILILFFIVLSGCVTYEPYSSVSMYGADMYFSPRPVESVQVFHNRPPGNYMEIGEITVERSYSLEKAKDVLRKRAASIGGDAVYIVDTLLVPESYSNSMGFNYGHNKHPYGYNYGYNKYPDVEYTVTGVIIRYTSK